MWSTAATFVQASPGSKEVSLLKPEVAKNPREHRPDAACLCVKVKRDSLARICVRPTAEFTRQAPMTEDGQLSTADVVQCPSSVCPLHQELTKGIKGVCGHDNFTVVFHSDIFSVVCPKVCGNACKSLLTTRCAAFHAAEQSVQDNARSCFKVISNLHQSGRPIAPPVVASDVAMGAKAPFCDILNAITAAACSSMEAGGEWARCSQQKSSPAGDVEGFADEGADARFQIKLIARLDQGDEPGTQFCSRLLVVCYVWLVVQRHQCMLAYTRAGLLSIPRHAPCGCMHISGACAAGDGAVRMQQVTAWAEQKSSKEAWLCFEASEASGKLMHIPSMLSGALKREWLACFPDTGGALGDAKLSARSKEGEAATVIRRVNMALHGWNCRLLPSLTCVPRINTRAARNATIPPIACVFRGARETCAESVPSTARYRSWPRIKFQ